MANIVINKKDEIVMKILHYFVTEENYRPIIVNGVQNEIWLENLENDISLIRININYIHNNEQLMTDMRKCNAIRRSIKKKTYSLRLNVLNLLLDTRSEVKPMSDKNIESIKINKITDLKKNKIVSTFFPNINEKLDDKKAGLTGMFEMTEQLNDKTNKEDKKLAKIFKGTKYPVVTLTLIAINIFVYLATIFNYSFIINNFANSFELVRAGQVYRLLTSTFVHANILHLAFNMYALYILGEEIEKFYGKGKFLIIYLLSGIIASLFSCTLNTGYSIGASGAIFGLFGALIYFGLKYRATLDGFLRSSIIPTLIINLIIGLSIKGIDIYAHIGGLIGGFILSYALCVPNKEKTRDHINGISIVILLIAFLIYLITIK